ncbi:hypothetical protein VNO77_37425 [Canavalia gladiata]|uniref:Uncharacterized protein n=1 Tax=Canavalia gladiata TaxID=3824 RepID=A0AAN9K879_CANGL
MAHMDGSPVIRLDGSLASEVARGSVWLTWLDHLVQKLNQGVEPDFNTHFASSSWNTLFNFNTISKHTCFVVRVRPKKLYWGVSTVHLGSELIMGFMQNVVPFLDQPEQ